MQASRSGSKTADDCSICLTPTSLDSVLLIDVLRDGADQDQLLRQPTYASKIRTRESYQPAQSQEQCRIEHQQSVSYLTVILREEREIQTTTIGTEINYNYLESEGFFTITYS